jgi:hypothetical protein
MPTQTNVIIYRLPSWQIDEHQLYQVAQTYRPNVDENIPEVILHTCRILNVEDHHKFNHANNIVKKKDLKDQ